MMDTSALSLPYSITCGYCDSSEFGGARVSPHRTVNLYEIEYYTQDAFTTTVNDDVYPIRKDHIKIGCPGQVCHSVLPFTTMYLKFRAEGPLCSLLEKAPTYFRCYHPDRARELLQRLALETGNPSNLLRYYSDILELLSIVLEDSELNSSAGPDYSIVESARVFMRGHFMEPLNLQDIAASVSLSGTYFHSIFSALTGKTPHAYLTELRITHAKHLLWDTRVPLSEIAEACGFSCQQYFSSVFRKETGTTPSAYRRVNQSNYLL